MRRVALVEIGSPQHGLSSSSVQPHALERRGSVTSTGGRLLRMVAGDRMGVTTASGWDRF